MPVVRTPVKNRPSNRASRAILARSQISAFSIVTVPSGAQACHISEDITMPHHAAIAVFRPHRWTSLHGKETDCRSAVG